MELYTAPPAGPSLNTVPAAGALLTLFKERSTGANPFGSPPCRTGHPGPHPPRVQLLMDPTPSFNFGFSEI